MEQRETVWQRWQVPLHQALRCALTAVLVTYQVGEHYAPLALGAVAAAGSGGNGLWALVGLGMGAMALMPFSSALPCVAVGILLYCVVSALGDLKWMDKPWPLPLFSMTLFFLISAMYLIQSLSPQVDWGICLCATAMVGAAVVLYRPLLDPDHPSISPNSMVFLLVSLCLTLGNVTAGGLSIGRMLLGALVLYVASQRGASGGGVLGLLAGLLVDVAWETGGLAFAASYALGAMGAGYLVAYGRIVTGLGYSVAVLFAALTLSGDMGAVLGMETLVSMGLFWALPRKLLGGKRMQVADSPAPHPTVERLRTQLNKTATALRDLYESMGRGATTQMESPGVIFDRATEQVCRGCTICSLCWQKEYATTHNAFNDATPYLMERGRVLAKDFPPQFSNRCIHLPGLLQAINTELSAYLLRKQYRQELEETRRTARGQYAQLSDLLASTAAGLGSVQPAMGQDLGYGLGAALRPKEGESLCGDTIDGFETDDGTLCLLLCDGMGSGVAAQKESALMVRLLRQFLQGGIHPEAALKTLGSAMGLRASTGSGFSTVDLLTCRLDTGALCLYKCGAAPSYVKKGGAVRRITGHGLPMGLTATPGNPDITQLQMEEGSFVILLSDGLSDGEEDEWLMNLLAGWSGTDPQGLANLIMTHSQTHHGTDDDGAVQVFYRGKGNKVKV